MPKWDPRAVLDIDPQRKEFKCRGTTKRGAKCKNSISMEIMQCLNRILDGIAGMNICFSTSPGDMKSFLRDLPRIIFVNKATSGLRPPMVLTSSD
jgi:hypothetical protein